MGKGAKVELVAILFACICNLIFKNSYNRLTLNAGNKKKANKQHGMDADDDAGWMTGPTGEGAGEEMDTREAGVVSGADAAPSFHSKAPGM
jgi:hypothetical protein